MCDCIANLILHVMIKPISSTALWLAGLNPKHCRGNRGIGCDYPSVLWSRPRQEGSTEGETFLKTEPQTAFMLFSPGTVCVCVCVCVHAPSHTTALMLFSPGTVCVCVCSRSLTHYCCALVCVVFTLFKQCDVFSLASVCV